jgi:diguanylate cyclase (GGDEF)-like protein
LFACFRPTDRFGLAVLGLVALGGAAIALLDPIERLAAWSLARNGLLLDEAIAGAILLPLLLVVLRRRKAAAPVADDIEALIASRDRFADFAKASGEWLWEMDADLKLQLVGRDAPAAARQLAGLLEEGVLSRPERVTVDREAWQRQWADITRRKPFRGLRFHLQDDDGNAHWLELAGVPAFDQAGRFIGYRGSGTNVTCEATAEARARHLALHDGLTNLPNRPLLLDRIRQATALGRARGERAALLSLDLDDFALVNDTLGHAAGDRLLVQCAERLRGVVQGVDLVARQGGDEFAIVQLSGAQPEAAAALAAAITEALGGPIDLGVGEVTVTASIGIALLPDDGQDAEELLKNADIALHQAKADGPGAFRFFEAGMDAELRARREGERELREALIDGQFELHYQPIVEAAARRVVGLEVLLRWRHPTRGLIPPADFIPLAEATGLMVPLGRWVLRSACAQATGWPGMRLSVNLTRGEFHAPDLVDHIREVLEEIGLPPGRLELEITETALLGEPEAAFARLEELKALGVRVAIDDFGTAYSSLTYLQRFAFDKIKIDQAFVEGLEHGAKEQAMVQAIISLAENLGLLTCAEAVETADQTALLRQQGCVELQGYYFSRPLEAAEIAPLLQAAAPRDDDATPAA